MPPSYMFVYTRLLSSLLLICMLIVFIEDVSKWHEWQFFNSAILFISYTHLVRSDTNIYTGHIHSYMLT